MLESAKELVEAGFKAEADGFIAEACHLLLNVYDRCDGQPKPPDFVVGEAALS